MGISLFNSDNEKNQYSILKKGILIGGAAIALGFLIKSIVKYNMEVMQKISESSGGSKEYTAAFEKKDFKPGCSFKGGGIRAMCSGLSFKLDDLKATDDISITCNAIMSGVEIIVPDDINVVTIDVSKLSGIANTAEAPFDSDKRTLKIYVSGFMSGIIIKRATVMN